MRKIYAAVDGFLYIDEYILFILAVQSGRNIALRKAKHFNTMNILRIWLLAGVFVESYLQVGNGVHSFKFWIGFLLDWLPNKTGKGCLLCYFIHGSGGDSGRRLSKKIGRFTITLVNVILLFKYIQCNFHWGKYQNAWHSSNFFFFFTLP